MTTPSAFHLAQLAIWKASMPKDEDFHRMMLNHELEMIELREQIDDPQTMRQAEELIRRVR